MMSKIPVTITNEALKHIRKVITPDKRYALIGVKGGGCNGMKYYIEATDEPDKLDITFEQQDTSIAICGKSLMYLIGTNITWKEDVMGSRIEFENPNAASKCGCGETFNVK